MKAEDVKEIRQLLKLTQDELAKKIGVARNTIINYERGGVIPLAKQQLLQSLLELAILNVDVKKVEIDDKAKVSAYSDNDIIYTSDAIPPINDKEDSGIPHVEKMSIGIPHIESVEAFCGPGQGFDIAVMRKECPVYNIPGMEGADFTIKAKGRSMINREFPDRSVKEGDYIGCVKCRSGVIRFGEVYALATSEGVMVKIVQESDREGYVLLESFNKEEGFKPFHYPVVDIHDMALVVAVASISRWA